jgi:aspartyl-tRNA(Asn)/glutamyl-tRNA(Gln) amidotransferase subunit A
LNAFCFLDSGSSIKEAKQSEKRWAKGSPKGLLDGVPFPSRTSCSRGGWPTLRGSKTIDPKGPWNDDAPVVARLREHGAVLLGKTTTPEFRLERRHRRPAHRNHAQSVESENDARGSSGGGAAAVASGMGPLTVGTDGGGSIRIPCAFTGLFGLKPSFGRVPAWPLSPMGTVAHVGPMTRTVTDAALMLNVLSLPDTRDWHALPHDGRDYRIGLEDGVKG